MAEQTAWLIDKSAFVRLRRSPDEAGWANRIQRGLVSIATPTLLEIGYSVRNAEEWTQFQSLPPIAAMPKAPTSVHVDRRALEVQGMLAQRGQHRAAKVPDLLIAAIAEFAGLTVLHVDKDFDLIAEVTGQPTERLAGDF